MNKFTQNIAKTNSAIKADRAAILSENVKDEQLELINALKKQARVLQIKKMDLEDLSPDNAQSLHPAKKDFNAAQWVAELQQTKLQLKITNEKLLIAEETYEEYFTEIEVKPRKTAVAK
jgi:hypothetical protein